MRGVSGLTALLVLLPVLGFWGAWGQDGRPGRNAKKAKKNQDLEAAALWTEAGRCEECHLQSSWRKIKEPAQGEFDHSTTGFPLRGAHASKDVTCTDCHRRGLSALTQSCNSCHHDPHAGWHTKACDQCHNERDWEVPRNFFDHEKTRFPLLGVHAAIGCEACHRNARTEPRATTPTECIVCHRIDFRSTANIPTAPDHTTGGLFNAQCQRCHENVIPPVTFKGAVIR
jgi:hypothetical protein